MTVIILPGQKTAKDFTGKIYEINGMVIKRREGARDGFYSTEDPFFKAAAAEGTESPCVMLDDEKINLL